MSVWFKSRLTHDTFGFQAILISIQPKLLWKCDGIASNVSIRTISPTATPLPKAYDCVAVYIAGRRTQLVV